LTKYNSKERDFELSDVVYDLSFMQDESMVPNANVEGELLPYGNTYCVGDKVITMLARHVC